MKILFLANNGEGLYKFRKELIIKLLEDNEVFVSLPKDNYCEKLESMGCKFIDTEFNRKGTNPIKDIELRNTYIKILKSINPNVVLTYTIKPSVYGGLACQKLNVPYLVNITGLGSAIENGGILQFIALTLYKLGIRKANKVFFQNDSNMNFMIDKKVVEKNKCKLIPGSGVNVKEYKVLEYPNSDTVDFVYIGRIMTEKGFKQYIEAAEIIRNKYKESRFHICGEYEDNYKDKVNELVEKGIVIYHGSVSNMIDIYKIIQCTIHPTYYAEGMSNVLLESLACGRPIITTNRPGCKEIVDDGVNGYIVKEKDTNDLVEKIEKFLSLNLEQRKQMGLNGRRKIEEKFDRNIVINEYLEEINKIK
jgi:glycosyltransferase involved in cell wall biosynthesis